MTWHGCLRDQHSVCKDASCREIEEWSWINCWQIKGKTQLLTFVVLVHAHQYSWVTDSVWMPIFNIKKEQKFTALVFITTVLYHIIFWLQCIFHRKKCGVDLNGSFWLEAQGKICLVFVICEPGINPDGAGVPGVLFCVITSCSNVLYNKCYVGESCILPITLHSLHTV